MAKPEWPTAEKRLQGAAVVMTQLARLAMKVRCSVRATSDGWLRWSVQPGAAVGCSRRSVPSATMPSTRRRLSSSDPSHHTTRSGRVVRAT